MKSNQSGSLSRNDLAARLRNLADEIESGTLAIAEESLVLPEQFEVTQAASTTKTKGSYKLELNWTEGSAAGSAGAGTKTKATDNGTSAAADKTEAEKPAAKPRSRSKKTLES